MEEIKVNDYIRTYQGDIGKAKTITSTGIIIEDERHIHFDGVTKHSQNIIDLIEVGDIVEIFDVLHNDIFYIWNEEMLKALREDIKNGIEIKSITTKEQFNSIKYVIGE